MAEGGGTVSVGVRCVLSSVGFVWNGGRQAVVVEVECESDAVQHDDRGAAVLEFRSEAGFEVGRGVEVASNEGSAAAGTEVESKPGSASGGSGVGEAVMARGDESGIEG